MAAKGESMELDALNQNMTSIKSIIKNDLRWFSDELVKRNFLVRREIQAILGTVGITPEEQASKLMDRVYNLIEDMENKRERFDEFVDIFISHGGAASDELVKKLKRFIDNESDTSTNAAANDGAVVQSSKPSSPKSPVSTGVMSQRAPAVCPPLSEGVMMAELLDTEVTEDDTVEIAKKYLKRWEELYPYLKLESGTDEIIRRTRGGYAEEKKALLSEWRDQHGRSGATFRVLIGAAEKAGNKLLADNIRLMLQEKHGTAGHETGGGAYRGGVDPGEATQSSGKGVGSIQDDSGNRGGEVRRRRETSQQHLVPDPPKPPPNTFVSGGWMMSLFRNKILVIVVFILLMLCSCGLLYYNWSVTEADLIWVILCSFMFQYYYWVTEAVLIWVIILFLVRMMFYKKDTFFTSGWTMLQFRKKILVIVMVILLMLCNVVLLFYYLVKMTETALLWVIMFEGWMMFNKIPKRDFYLDKKKGVLILVTSTYNGTLTQTATDRNEMMTTFTQLDYHIEERRDNDANRSNVLMLLQQLSDYLSRYSGPLSERALVFGFSGHGNSGTIQLDDHSKISIMDDIVKYYVQHRKVFDIPKIFFIDACRGGEVMTKSLSQIVSKYEATKGEATKGRAHEEGNFLIAYATIDQHVAYDGNWMYKLAKKIGSDLNVPLTTILNNLAGNVTGYQQPELVSRLRKDFSFGM